MTNVWDIRPVLSTRVRQVCVAAAAATLGLLTVASLSTPAPSQSRSRVALAVGDASSAFPLHAKMNIIPAPVIDPGAAVFVGAGDGSNGFWIRP
jgi:hypothetical protein